jgi:carbonic anhydrase
MPPDAVISVYNAGSPYYIQEATVSVERLLEGYWRFRKTRFVSAQELYKKLGKQGQSPEVLFIACCDSRVDPAAIFDAGPGELFVIRNVANLVPPWAPDGRHHGTSAAIEFAVRHLKVREIVVMGHAQCGGAAALLNRFHEQPGASDFIGSWISLAEEAKHRMLARQAGDGDPQRELEYEIVRLSLANLMGFSWVREKVEAGELSLHGWHFGITHGKLAILDRDSDEFRIIEDPAA